MRRFVAYFQSKSYKGWRLVLVLFLCAALGSRYIVWQDVLQNNNKTATHNFSSVVQSDIRNLQNRFEVYADTLYSGRALFMADDSVTRSAWTTFVDSQNITQRYPGVYAIAYISVIPRSQASTFTNRLNANALPTDNKSFTIYPVSSAPALDVVTYMAPETSDQHVIGYDLSTSSARKQALDAARDSGLPKATPPLTLVSADTGAEDSFLEIMPIYSSLALPDTVQARRANISGYVVLALHVQPLLDSIFKTIENNMVAVTATTTGHTLYHNGNPQGAQLRQTLNLDVAGQAWQFTFRAPGDFNLSLPAKRASKVVLLSGIPLALLLGIAFYYAVRFRLLNTHHRNHHGGLEEHSH